MKIALVVIVVSLGVVTPGFSASDSFSTDRPSPLKLAKPGKEHSGVVRFTGNVQLSGQFLVGWELINNKPAYLRVVFFPDKDSAALLPHAAGDGPVKELFFSNAEQAASLLLDPAATQKILVKELLSATGEAMVAIRDYQTVVECDHRWYTARLVSASKSPQIVADTRENVRFGC